MADLVVSATVDTLMQAANQAAAKTAIGLGNVDNTTDANKPISTLTQTALNAKQATLVSGTNIKTVNGTTLLGSGDLVVSGGGGGSGDLTLTYSAKTANYTLTGSDRLINCTSGTFTLTLPTAVGATGKVYDLKNTGSGVITLNTTSSQTIDSSASGALTLNQWDNLTVVSDGANWIII
jgi:hypothetical protein